MGRRSRNNNRRRNNNERPMAVITVPTMLAPTFSVPVEFSVTATTMITLPSNLILRNIRITSIRCTAVPTAAGGGQVRIEFLQPIQLATSPTVITRISRLIPVSGGSVELAMRNDKRVQHATFGGGIAAPSVVRITTTGSILVSGVYMVSVMGPFG